jgi:hypothetical protein
MFSSEQINTDTVFDEATTKVADRETQHAKNKIKKKSCNSLRTSPQNLHADKEGREILKLYC